MKVLIVDDEFPNRMLLKTILGSMADCDLAINGAEAVEIFEMELMNGEPYDLVLLDIMMPEMDGEQALVGIRQMEESAYGPKPEPGQGAIIIMVTALDAGQEHINACFRSGCNDYLAKPVLRNVLLNKLREHKLLPSQPGS
ncbi:MAG: response regulator [Magnetococcales bacterium]|nr:response regulator [Magnetococcales bacterium]